MLLLLERSRRRVFLTWRARPDEVKAFQRKRQCVGLVELKRITRLRLDVHANDFEAGAMQAHTRAASAAKKIKGARPAADQNGRRIDVTQGYAPQAQIRGCVAQKT